MNFGKETSDNVYLTQGNLILIHLSLSLYCILQFLSGPAIPPNLDLTDRFRWSTHTALPPNAHSADRARSPPDFADPMVEEPSCLGLLDNPHPNRLRTARIVPLPIHPTAWDLILMIIVRRGWRVASALPRISPNRSLRSRSAPAGDRSQPGSAASDRRQPDPVMPAASPIDDYDAAEKLIHRSWAPALQPEFRKGYMLALKKRLKDEQSKGVVIYPPSSLVFRALELPMEQIRVVVIGQDPYHSPGQAEGLAFSVPRGVPIPSSLKNVYRELSSDIPGFRIPSHGSLHNWASQGVLLLNAALTVRSRSANSHKDIGWDQFTDHILRSIIKEKKDDPVVFLLWGRYAQQKGLKAGLHAHKNPNFLILNAAHPSGLSAHRGFFGCKHFSRTNEFLQSNGVKPIDWQL